MNMACLCFRFALARWSFGMGLGLRDLLGKRGDTSCSIVFLCHQPLTLLGIFVITLEVVEEAVSLAGSVIG